jgi:hypothetical protein
MKVVVWEGGEVIYFPVGGSIFYITIMDEAKFGRNLFFSLIIPHESGEYCHQSAQTVGVKFCRRCLVLLSVGSDGRIRFTNMKFRNNDEELCSLSSLNIVLRDLSS